MVGRWAPHARKYPTTEHWREVSRLFMDFARRHASADLLMKFALGKVEESPFGAEAISILKNRVIESLSRWGYSLKSSPQDRTDLPIDHRFLELLLDASGDPEVGLGMFARGVRVGPGSRLPRLPALYAKKKRCNSLSNVVLKIQTDFRTMANRCGAVIILLWDPWKTKSERCLKIKQPGVKS